MPIYFDPRNVAGSFRFITSGKSNVSYMLIFGMFLNVQLKFMIQNSGSQFHILFGKHG